MEIIRADIHETGLFSPAQLARGACCFHSKDRSCTYFFEIVGRQATLYASAPLYIVEAIDEFLFYSSFVCHIVDSNGKILLELPAAEMTLTPISDLQPSQFYINELKLEHCKRWISSQSDIMVPTAFIESKITALDGHTRLRAALELGYTHAYTYCDDSGEYIGHFAREAAGRGILQISDMELVSDEQYRLKWHKYCDDFFANVTPRSKC